MSKRIEDLVGIVDIVPTVCGRLSIDVPKHVQGQDLSLYVLGRGRPQWAPQGHTAANRGLWLTAANARTREAMALGVVCRAADPSQKDISQPGFFPWPWHGVLSQTFGISTRYASD